MPRQRFASPRYFAICSAAGRERWYSRSRKAIADSSSPSWRGASGTGSSASTAARSFETAVLISVLRDGASPSQNGIDGGWPWASATRTVPLPMRRIRHEVLPSWKTSPGSDFDGEVLVQLPTTVAFGLENHLVVEHFGNRARHS
jgi:hypothetical protein